MSATHDTADVGWFVVCLKSRRVMITGN